MKYTITFNSAEELNIVVNALDQQPHKVVRGVVDNILKQTASIEAAAEAKALEEAADEPEEEKSSVKEVEKTDS